MAATAAQDASIKARYEKREVLIPMRDGVKLFTIIYSPRDASRTHPFLMTRTGYGIPPYGDEYRGVLGPNAAFTDEGYIFVYQDTRGRFRSEGEFVHHAPYIKGSGKANESTDTYDTIEWLLKNVPNHNGRVGQYGISLAGWHASMGLIDAHPALRASSPQAPPQDQFLGDDYHSGGASCPTPSTGCPRTRAPDRRRAMPRRSASTSARPTATGSSWISAQRPMRAACSATRCRPGTTT
jgi:hypothetical protein